MNFEMLIILKTKVECQRRLSKNRIPGRPSRPDPGKSLQIFVLSALLFLSTLTALRNPTEPFMSRYIAIFLGLLTLTSCGPEFMVIECLPEPHTWNKPLQGTYDGLRYYDSAGFFSIDIPDTFRFSVEENYKPERQSSQAIFSDIPGRIRRVEVATWPDDLYCKLVCQHNCNGETLRGLFHECVLKVISEQFPRTKLIHETLLNPTDADPSLFATLVIPDLVTISIDGQQCKRDSYRGYLVFWEENQCVFLSCQLSPLPDYEVNDKIAATLEELTEMRKSYRNETRLKIPNDCYNPLEDPLYKDPTS